MATLTGKIALVTGASRDIGAAIATRLAAEGAQVVVHYHSNVKEAEDVVGAIKKKGGKAFHVQCELTDPMAVDHMLEEIKSVTGRIDILVNNAAQPGMQMFMEGTPEEWDRVFTMNVKATYFVTQKVVRDLMPDGGRVITMSSGASQNGGGPIYGASRAAEESFTRHWASELRKRKINVNTVTPGFVITDMVKRVMTPAQIEQSRAGAAQPNDTAGIIAFFAGPDSACITGQQLNVGHV